MTGAPLPFLANMRDLTIIVAYDANRGIGINNTLPWHLPEDLIRFKQITTGHAIIMGRKTYESIGRPLPNRRNIVLTRQTGWHADGIDVAASLEQALGMVDGQTPFVIGGAEIFNQALPLCQTILATEIQRDITCDAFFPAIDPDAWRETARESHHSDKNSFDYAFVTYLRN